MSQGFRYPNYGNDASPQQYGTQSYGTNNQPHNPYDNAFAATSNVSLDSTEGKDQYGGPGRYGAGAGAAYLGARERQQTRKTRRKGLLFAGAAILVIVGAIAGGIFESREHHTSHSSSSNSTDSTGLQYINGTAKAVKSDPSDPSKFETDSRLHQSFWGIAYTPYLAQEPWCGVTLANVTEDIQLISQLTTRMRTYGSGCNQSALVLQAIQDTKVNMTVWLGVYIGDNTTVNTQQIDNTLAVIQTYGTDHVSGVTIGNEYILDASDQTTATTFIVEQMASFRTQLGALNLTKSIPVGTSDAGSMITTKLAEGADYVQANVHAFFGGLPIAQAADWVWEYFEENDVAAAEAATNKPPAYVAETGWPTDSMTEANRTDGAAVAGVGELQTFLDTYVCTANKNGTQYFFFETFDEPWKEQYGGVEPYWGLFDANKVLKNLTLPSC